MLEKLSVIVSVFNLVQSGQRIIERVFGMICTSRMLGNSMETNRIWYRYHYFIGSCLR